MTSSRSADQGSILMYVLATTLFLGIMGTAILSLALTTARATTGHTKTGDRFREIDSALEIATHRVRVAPDTDRPCKPLENFDVNDFTFTCTLIRASGAMAPGAPLQDPSQISLDRTMDVSVARLGQADAVGAARIRVTDYLLDDSDIGYEKFPGYLIEVCDWKVGVRASNETLGGCV